MKHISKRVAAALLVVAFAIGMTVPALSFAQAPDGPTMTGAINANAKTGTLIAGNGGSGSGANASFQR